MKAISMTSIASALDVVSDHLRDNGLSVTGVTLSGMAGDLRNMAQQGPKYPGCMMYVPRETLDSDPHISYDSALPQEIYNDVMRVTGENPCGHLVTVYQHTGSVFGGLVPVDYEGVNILRHYLAGEVCP